MVLTLVASVSSLFFTPRNVEAHMRLLFYTTERLIRRMKPPVEKQVIFVHLPDFSLWNT
jgi:hypothetical protein